MKENRKGIEEALLVLASRSEGQSRRLDDGSDHPVSASEIGEDMISFFDCFCDESNPGNDGCTRRTLKFAEDVATALSQAANRIAENPAEVLLKVSYDDLHIVLHNSQLVLTLFILKAHSSLEKHTNHLRQSGPFDPKSSEVYSSVERAMSEIQEGCPGGLSRVEVNQVTKNVEVCL